MSMYTKPASIIPDNDLIRLNKLREYEILDTPAEESFDSLANLAAQIFGTPSAFITFVDYDRVFFKANLSDLKGREVKRSESLCSLAILQEEITVFTDTQAIPDLKDNPFVCAEGGIRFYVGAPLKTPEGHNMGTICVIDNKAGFVSQEQIDKLRTLSKVVIDQLESRLRSKKAIKAQVDLLNMTMHEIKNPLSNIKLALEIIGDKINGDTDIEQMIDIINRGATNINNRVTDALKLSKLEHSGFKLNSQEFDVVTLIKNIKRDFRLQIARKKQHIEFSCSDEIILYADKEHVKDIIYNLVSNAIKFSHENATTKINLAVDEKNVLITVSDEGQGLTTDDMENLFVRYAVRSALPTAKETSAGLGLSICKALVEIHHGKIWAESEGKNKGTTFYVSLPITRKAQL